MSAVAVLMVYGASSGTIFSCPDYTTVTLKAAVTGYTVPLGSAAELQAVNCAYTPPTVT